MWLIVSRATSLFRQPKLKLRATRGLLGLPQGADEFAGASSANLPLEIKYRKYLPVSTVWRCWPVMSRCNLAGEKLWKREIFSFSHPPTCTCNSSAPTSRHCLGHGPWRRPQPASAMFVQPQARMLSDNLDSMAGMPDPRAGPKVRVHKSLGNQDTQRGDTPLQSSGCFEAQEASAKTEVSSKFADKS